LTTLGARGLIIHCSDSEFGDAALIDLWHKERRFKKIGYHYVILNGYKTKRVFNPKLDGILETGRELDERGAHCRGHNEAIGVCLIGKRLFSAKQLLVTLPQLIKDLSEFYRLDVKGHCEYDIKKTCPNIDMSILRGYL
jgi:hypothetical protein